MFELVMGRLMPDTFFALVSIREKLLAYGNVEPVSWMCVLARALRRS